MFRNADLMQNEQEYADLSADAAVEHLAAAVRFNTTGYVDTSRICYEEFDRMQRYLEGAYPHVMAAGEREYIGHSILIRIPGTDASLAPGMCIAHQDVVPVVAGTEGDWLHDPFSGDVADGYIWGRGSIDIKNMMIAELEAAEYLLASGRKPVRSLYLAFGEDEETLNTGAYAIGQKLLKEGTRLEYVLDEGIPAVTDAGIYGAPGVLTIPIGISEKGYADLYLRARSTGGHSSNPVHGTSLGHLAKAITQIVENPPKAVLSDSCLETLRILKPYITEEPLRSYAADPDKYTEEILDYFVHHEELYYKVQTTVAPTMISGGSQAGNVMPQNMEAVINFRLCAQDTTDSLLDYVRGLIDPAIETGYVQCINASIPSEIDSFGYRSLVEALEHFYGGVHFIPALNKGATDAHNYECVSRCCYRIAPFVVENEVQAEGMHGTNERISIRAFLQGIRVLIRFLETTCFTLERRPADE